MRYCSKCAQNLDDACFNKNISRKTGLQVYCKECSKVVNNESYAKSETRRQRIKQNSADRVVAMRKLVNKAKSGGCIICDEKNTCALDFHHVRSNKAFDLGTGVNHFGTTKLMEEINKCVVLCANCHRIETYKGN